jgi:2-aminoadipate transaminase
MTTRFSRRTSAVKRSFIREILKVTERPEIISFAGGLPSPTSFPVAQIAKATQTVFDRDGAAALQYQTTEGFPPLRAWIAERYNREWNLDVSPDEILITTGSQQSIDLLGKALIDQGDRVLLERPSYLGAIQAFQVYEPQFVHVPLSEEGLDAAGLRAALGEAPAKMLYVVPNFQNPSGISYSDAARRAVCGALRGTSTLLVEDDPYSALRFRGRPLPPLRSYYGPGSVMLGTFSKTVSPGIRTGWICAPPEIREMLVTLKQAADLHSDALSQRILHEYLTSSDTAAHIEKIRAQYGRQCDAMLAAIAAHCPSEVKYTRPEGGMFLWMTLPEGVSSLKLFDRALAAGVAFVPGIPFYTDGGGDNTLRLNFSNSDKPRIEEGIRRLGRAIREELAVR